MTDRRVVIVPCSGIGKTYGSVSREAAYQVTEDMRPARAQLVALSLLVLGDEETRGRIPDLRYRIPRTLAQVQRVKHREGQR